MGTLPLGDVDAPADLLEKALRWRGRDAGDPKREQDSVRFWFFFLVAKIGPDTGHANAGMLGKRMKAYSLDYTAARRGRDFEPIICPPVFRFWCCPFQPLASRRAPIGRLRITTTQRHAPEERRSCASTWTKPASR